LPGSLVGQNQKSQGRAMFKAWQQDQGKAKGAVLDAIFNSAAKFNARTGGK
jgi:hypothetical protein